MGPPTRCEFSLSSDCFRTDGDRVELQRLVVEDSEMALAVDFHSGLTVAFHENPAVRARFIDRLIDGLGPGHPGVHLELTDAQNRHLAVFRPHGNRHRVIDIDSAQDISAQYASPDDRVDVLGRAGLDVATVLELIRMTAQQVDGGSNTGTDNHRLARQLAGVDQKQLWEAAAALRDAESLLATCAPIASTDAPTEAPAPTQAPMTLIGRTQELRAVAELHDQVEIAARSRRSVRTFGFALAALCSGLATVLFLLNGALDDGNWTAKALAALAVVAAVLTIADGKSYAPRL